MCLIAEDGGNSDEEDAKEDAGEDADGNRGRKQKKPAAADSK